MIASERGKSETFYHFPSIYDEMICIDLIISDKRLKNIPKSIHDEV